MGYGKDEQIIRWRGGEGGKLPFFRPGNEIILLEKIELDVDFFFFFSVSVRQNYIGRPGGTRATGRVNGGTPQQSILFIIIQSREK